MNARPWQPHEDHFLRFEAPGRSTAWTADWLDRTRSAVKQRARKLGVSVGTRRAISAAERRAVRERYGREPAAAIAADLGRTLRAVYRLAKILGVADPKDVARTERMRRSLPRLAAAGLTDTAIARVVGFSRTQVSAERRRQRLAAAPWTPERRAAVGRAMRATCRAKGVANLAEIRSEIHRAYARAEGWPEDLRPMSVAVLSALWELGPMTRREICEAIGDPWKGPSRSLVSNDAEGTPLAHLAARGLVVRVLCAGPKYRPDAGRNADLYLPALDLQRGPVAPPDPADDGRPRHRNRPR